MTYAFLPRDETTWLCRVDGALVQPLAVVPGDARALGQIAATGTEFGFLETGATQSWLRVGSSGMSPALLRYCESDTLAMVMICEAWRELASCFPSNQQMHLHL